jgi:hypothetical protein
MDLYGASTAQEYADFAVWSRESPVFRAWAQAVSEDDELLARIDTLPRVKRQPNLVFAAARWHGAEPGPYDGLRDVLLARWPEVEDTILRRATQTNEVGRCATVLPVLAMLPGPLAVLELGCSAGLCLHPDRYSYRWSDGTVLHPAAGPSRVVLECAVTGDPPLPAAMPEVAWRGGVDLNPLDLHDADAMAWLRNLVWPGQDARLRRLEAAIEVAGAHEPPHVVAGDLLEKLPGLLDLVPGGATPVVFHSAVIAYLDEADRARFADMMAELVAAGRCHWVANESPDALPSNVGDVEPPRDRFVLALDGRPVAWTHGHGRALDWLPGRPKSR